MTKLQILLAIIGIPVISVITEKLLMAFWRWLRRDTIVKDLAKEIIELRKERDIKDKELTQYKDRQRIQNDLQIYGGIVYKSKTTGETYCVTCWDDSGKLIHVIPQHSSYYCGVCKKRTDPT